MSHYPIAYSVSACARLMTVWNIILTSTIPSHHHHNSNKDTRTYNKSGDFFYIKNTNRQKFTSKIFLRAIDKWGKTNYNERTFMMIDILYIKYIKRENEPLTNEPKSPIKKRHQSTWTKTYILIYRKVKWFFFEK